MPAPGLDSIKLMISHRNIGGIISLPWVRIFRVFHLRKAVTERAKIAYCRLPDEGILLRKITIKLVTIDNQSLKYAILALNSKPFL